MLLIRCQHYCIYIEKHNVYIICTVYIYTQLYLITKYDDQCGLQEASKTCGVLPSNQVWDSSMQTYVGYRTSCVQPVGTCELHMVEFPLLNNINNVYNRTRILNQLSRLRWPQTPHGVGLLIKSS